MEITFLPLTLYLLIVFPIAVNSYDTTDLEIFDLVEEIGIQNSFYDVLQISQVSKFSCKLFHCVRSSKII